MRKSVPNMLPETRRRTVQALRVLLECAYAGGAFAEHADKHPKRHGEILETLKTLYGIDVRAELLAAIKPAPYVSPLPKVKPNPKPAKLADPSKTLADARTAIRGK